MTTLLEVFSSPLSELLFTNYHLYLPRLYANVLYEIEQHENSREFAIVLLITKKNIRIYLLMTCMYETLTPETQRLIQLNQLHPYLYDTKTIALIRSHTTTVQTNLQLFGLYKDGKSILEAICIKYHLISNEKFHTFITCMEKYQPLPGYHYDLLAKVIAIYSKDAVQEAIEYEIMMNQYEFNWYSSNSSSEDEKLTQVPDYKLKTITHLTTY